MSETRSMTAGGADDTVTMGSNIDAAARTGHGPCLVIDTSYGLTIGVVGHEPCHIADSRAHVEKLGPTVRQVLEQAGLSAQDLSTIVVASGPGPFTGLRAGIVAARALAFATGARLLGHDVLSVQAAWERKRPHTAGPRLVLTVNDARRKQLYWQLWRIDGTDDGDDDDALSSLTPMDISYPQTIAGSIMDIEQTQDRPLPLVIIGPGTAKYGSCWDWLAGQGIPVAARVDDSALCADGAEGPALFADLALHALRTGGDISTEPLYLRRPDAKVPPMLKPVAENSVRSGQQAQGGAGVPADRRAQAPQSALEATREGRDLTWSSWSKEDLRRFATKTDPSVDDDDQPDELVTFGSRNNIGHTGADGGDGR